MAEMLGPRGVRMGGSSSVSRHTWGGSRVRKPDARIGTNSRREGRPRCRSCIGWLATRWSGSKGTRRTCCGQGCAPVGLQVLCNVLASFIKLVLVKDDVEHLGRTLGELLSGHQLHIDVPRLRLPPGLDQTLEDFGAGDFEVDHNWGEGGLGELAGVVHGVTIQHNQLHRARKFKNPLYLGLHLCQVVRPRVGLLENGPLRWVVQHGLLAQRDVRRYPGYDYPSFKLVFQKLKNRFLHHISHLITLEAWSNQYQWPDAWNHVVRRKGLLFFAQESLLLLYDRWGSHPDTPALHSIVVPVKALRGGCSGCSFL